MGYDLNKAECRKWSPCQDVKHLPIVFASTIYTNSALTLHRCQLLWQVYLMFNCRQPTISLAIWTCQHWLIHLTYFSDCISVVPCHCVISKVNEYEADIRHILTSQKGRNKSNILQIISDVDGEKMQSVYIAQVFGLICNFKPAADCGSERTVYL